METDNAQTTPQTPEPSGLTPAQTLALETARLERVKAQADLLREQSRHAELQAESRARAEEDAIRAAVADSKIKFHDSADAVLIARKDYQLTHDETGAAFGIIDGKKAPLGAILEDIARQRPYLADGRTIKHLNEPETEPQLYYDQMSREERITFLRDHSVEQLEALPRRRPMKSIPINELTAEDYQRLAFSEKSKILSDPKLGPDFVGRLPRRDGKGTHRFNQ